MDVEEKPSPTVSDDHANFGPSAGHTFKRLVSFEIPSRNGPRHCGHWAEAFITEIKNIILTATLVKLNLFVFMANT
jgi:hypothetical protein